MRGRLPTVPMASINANPAYRATSDDDSHSSTSNSPARADYEESDFFAGNNDSQSSIGVPTFQDMAVVEEVCLSPANKLPAEVLIGIFSKLNNPQDLLNCLRVSKKWARNSVDLLWHRPAFTTFGKLGYICRTLGLENPYFAYREFIKRLNLSLLSGRVNDGSVFPLATCTRIERLTLTGCEGLTDHGLAGLLTDSNQLLALDITKCFQITETSMYALAANCPRLQGLNITGCFGISNTSMIRVAESCRHLKRLKLNDCSTINDEAVMAFARNCRNILEIDLQGCREIGNEPITELITNGNCLRELRLANCEKITDNAFLNLPRNRTYEALRILDLTMCSELTDYSVDKIIQVAPRLRNIVFAKCRRLTDAAVNAICKLGKNLHYLHLGHCGQITDNAVIRLVRSCNRIRYIDLGCCTNLTDASVTKLADLPKLRRIGLVKCSAITDESVMALAAAQKQRRNIRYTHGDDLNGSSSLERVHLSYCTNLTLDSIIELLNNCQKLTHLSLTGVQAFLRGDLEKFCREAPPEFTEHQRNVFCVFSGPGVTGLRNHLNGLAHGVEQVEAESAPGSDSEFFEGLNPLPPTPLQDADVDNTMTGMMGAAAVAAVIVMPTDDNDGDVDVDGDGDEELDDEFAHDMVFVHNPLMPSMPDDGSV